MKRLIACLFLVVTSAAVMAAAPTTKPTIDSPATWSPAGVYNTDWGCWQVVSTTTIKWTYNNTDETDFLVKLYDDTSLTWVTASGGDPVGGPTPAWTTGILETSHQYKVQVAATNAGGTGPWSDWFPFVGQLAGSPVGVPIFDFSEGTVFTTKTPTITWTPLPGALRYYFGVYDYVAWSWVQAPITQTARSWTPTSDLIASHTYGIVVVAGNNFGWGTWSAWGHFYVTSDTKPAAPNITLPADINNAATPTVAWDTVDGADNYYMWIYDLTAYNQGNYAIAVPGTYIGGQYGGADNPIVPGDTQSWGNTADWNKQPAEPVDRRALKESHQYQVQVGAGNQFGWTWSPWHPFHVGLNTAPAAAPFTLPVNNDNWVALAVSLQWLTVDRAFKYYVVLDDLDAVPPTEVTTTVWSTSDPVGTTRWWNPTGGLIQDHHYSAQMAAGNDWGWAWNSRIYFQARHVDPLPAPVVTDPSGTNTNPTLDVDPAGITVHWGAITGASKYYLQLYNYGPGGTYGPVETVTLYTNSYTTPALIPLNRYGVSLEAGNLSGWSGNWSAWAGFKPGLTTVPAVPALTAPTGNNNNLDPTFTWNAVSGATSYWLTVTDTGNSQVVFDAQVGTTTVWPATTPVNAAPVVLTAGGSYSAVIASQNRLSVPPLTFSSPPLLFGVDPNAGMGVAIHVTVRP